MAGLKAVSNYTYNVTLPFLNCMKRMDQNSLWSIMPNLFQELQNGNLIWDDLKPFHVKWTHVTMEKQEPKTNFDKYLIKLLCQSEASRSQLQCVPKYWSNQEGTVRATVVYALDTKQQLKLPANILCAKRFLVKFGNLAFVYAHHSNKFFRGKRTRDDLMFKKSKELTEKVLLKTLKNILKALNSMEVYWTLQQREILKTRVAEPMEKFRRANELRNARSMVALSQP